MEIEYIDSETCLVNGETAYAREGTSREIFIWENEDKEYIIKFDIAAAPRTKEDWFDYQSSFELDRYQEFDEEDKKFFVPVVAGKSIPFGEQGRGYIVQEFLELEHRIKAEQRGEIERVIDKYKIIDVNSYGRNCAINVKTQQPVIYDWGMAEQEWDMYCSNCAEHINLCNCDSYDDCGEECDCAYL